jgi:hypothetical protein
MELGILDVTSARMRLLRVIPLKSRLRLLCRMFCCLLFNELSSSLSSYCPTVLEEPQR